MNLSIMQFVLIVLGTTALYDIIKMSVIYTIYKIRMNKLKKEQEKAVEDLKESFQKLKDALAEANESLLDDPSELKNNTKIKPGLH